MAVVEFLDDLRLEGHERVLGSLLIALADGMEGSPAYARAKFARELREVLAELRSAETNPRNLELLEGLRL